MKQSGSPISAGVCSSTMKRLYRVDLELAQSIYWVFGTHPMLRICWELIAHSSDGIFWFLMVLPVLCISWLAGYLDGAPISFWYLVTFAYMCNTVDIVAIILLKLMFKRQRPPHHRTDGRFRGPDQHSFPSGHATRAWCVAGLVVYLAKSQPNVIEECLGWVMAANAWASLACSWAILICFTRLALGRHYPSDVLAGSVIGFFVQFPIAKALMDNVSMHYFQ